MTVWELMQELMQYKPEDEVVVEVVGDCVEGELCSVSADESEGCMSFDNVSKSYDVIPDSRKNRAVIEVDI